MLVSPVDPRTPVIVGVGQFTERIDDPGYRGMSSVDLATAAARAALADTGADVDAVAGAIDTVVGIRQCEISSRGPAPLGSSTNYPRSVCHRIGAAPARAVLEPIGGQGPQHAVTEFAAEIAAGGADVVLVLGSENGSTLRYFAKRAAEGADKPDHSETVEGQLDDRGLGYDGLFTKYTVAHGMHGAPAQYGLLENARRGRVEGDLDHLRVAALGRNRIGRAPKPQQHDAPVREADLQVDLIAVGAAGGDHAAVLDLQGQDVAGETRAKPGRYGGGDCDRLPGCDGLRDALDPKDR